jgi:chlorobactene glucosyltransferase
LLVPVRNEALNLRERLLPGLLAVAYRELEILFLDDQSTDETSLLLRQFQEQARCRVEIISGQPLPAGWVGKSWACHQLAEAARGGIWIFCDADVAVGPFAVARTVSALQETAAGCLSALPRQETRSWMEKTLVPFVMELPIAGLVPLSLLPRSRVPGLVVANGQWMAFTRSAYRKSGGHAAVGRSLLEDIDLAARVHRFAPVVAVMATRDLAVRMYRGPGEVWEGFSKNVYPLVGGTLLAMAVCLVLHLFIYGFPLIGWVGRVPLAGLAIAGLLIWRVLTLLLYRGNWTELAWFPIGIGLFPILAGDSCWRSRAGKLRWKGRDVRMAPGKISGAVDTDGTRKVF